MALTRPRFAAIPDSSFKESCTVITTGNVNMYGGAPKIYDGYSLQLGDRVLVNGQTNGFDNGIYFVANVGTGSNGTWQRAADAVSPYLQCGIVTTTSSGTYAGKIWSLSTPNPITVGVTPVTFFALSDLAGGANTQVQFNNSGQLTGSSNFTFNTTGNVLTVGNIKIASGGNITFADGTNQTTVGRTVAYSLIFGG